MKFRQIPVRSWPPQDARDQVFLQVDNWDDFGFKCLWTLHYVDRAGFVETVGGVKIGQFGLVSGRPPVPESFEMLPRSMFSLGQDEEFYLKLQQLPHDVGRNILLSLRDIAADAVLLEQVVSEDVTQTALLRTLSETEVRNQFYRLARGGGRLSPYSFSFWTPGQARDGRLLKPRELTFTVTPESRPPSNVHVVIGRNGVGKSFLLNNMANVLVRGTDPTTGWIDFQVPANSLEASEFANVVTVAFSAFDQFEPLEKASVNTGLLSYSYIGLKKEDETTGDTGWTSKNGDDLRAEFLTSLEACKGEPKRSRWVRALELLQSDPNFAEQMDSVLNAEGFKQIKSAARIVFDEMSSGHKIVLLTLTRLVETVEEATLVLLDEPESHLHPPLLSAFIRALSDLLEDRNGVAVIATHSPVILQEVPRSCVWKLRRAGDELVNSRPELETFGENVGTLTQEVFGLEVTGSGFHRTLQEVVARSSSYEEVLEAFDGQLGAEARALAQSMIFLSRQ